MKYLFQNCVRQSFVTLILLSLLFFCGTVNPQQLSMKLSMGMFSGGQSTDSWETDQKFYHMFSSPGKRADPGPEMFFSILYMLHKNLGFSLGSGYAIKSVNGTRLDFTPRAENDFQDTYTSTPVLYSSFIPLDISAILSFPVSYLLSFNFSVGIDYYIGKIRTSTSDDKHRSTINPAIIGGRLAWKYISDAQTLGYHLGTELELGLADSTSLTLEVLYRSAVFKSFDTQLREKSETLGAIVAATKGLNEENLGDKDTFLYLQRYMNIDIRTDINFRLSTLDLSGFAVRLGLKFTF